MSRDFKPPSFLGPIWNWTWSWTLMGAEDLNSLHSLLNAKWRRLKWTGILNPSMLRSKIPTTVLYDVLLLRRHLPFDRGRLTGVTG